MKKKAKQPTSDHVVVVIDCCGDIAGYWCPHCNKMLFRGAGFTPTARCDTCRKHLDWSAIE